MDPKPQITYDDFVRLDLLVATVKSAEAHPNADKLLLLQLDDGSEHGRQICAGIRQHYSPEEMVGKQIIVVANLEPRTIRGEVSNGMLCAASDASAGDGSVKVVVLTTDKPVTPGSRVS